MIQMLQSYQNLPFEARCRRCWTPSQLPKQSDPWKSSCLDLRGRQSWSPLHHHHRNMQRHARGTPLPCRKCCFEAFRWDDLASWSSASSSPFSAECSQNMLCLLMFIRPIASDVLCFYIFQNGFQKFQHPIDKSYSNIHWQTAKFTSPRSRHWQFAWGVLLWMKSASSWSPLPNPCHTKPAENFHPSRHQAIENLRQRLPVSGLLI